MASHMQEQEVGDGTNFVLVFAGALLESAEELLRMGLSVSEVSGRHRRLLSLKHLFFFPPPKNGEVKILGLTPSFLVVFALRR